VTPPDGEGRSYNAKRGFRAALPGFRFKSGMRFDLSNTVLGGDTQWSVRFFFGPSKDIRQIELDGEVTKDLRRSPWFAEILGGFRGELARAQSFLAATSPNSLESAPSRSRTSWLRWLRNCTHGSKRSLTRPTAGSWPTMS
jgi:DNA (cytosine-5)-methyltransferase 1